MYAVFQVSGFQFNAEEGEVLRIPLQKVDKGSKLDFDEVLLLKDDDTTLIGNPLVDGAKIEAEVLEHGKDGKITIYKYKRRTKYRLTQGHRQDFSEIKINKIIAPEK
ncbi:MAG: 50S ribosomal protein L21 [Candidatus Zixiibacteriota bacterium]|nr:MAG: 50S ribosomal protein L21 [candidate division Zixibacteria bacterium]